MEDISFKNKFNGVCGFTQEELEKYFSDHIEYLRQEYQLQSYNEALDKLEKKYKGYKFSPDGEKIYNPFSISRCLKELHLGNFWYYASTLTFFNTHLKDVENENSSLEEWLKVDDLKLRERKSLNLTPLLWQSGFLTIVDYKIGSERYAFKDQKYFYKLDFPNNEVRIAYRDDLLNYIEKISGEAFKKFVLKV